MTHYIVVREDGAGRYLAHPVGLPELTVTADNRADAVAAATNGITPRRLTRS